MVIFPGWQTKRFNVVATEHGCEQSESASIHSPQKCSWGTATYCEHTFSHTALHLCTQVVCWEDGGVGHS